ncbi:MAG: bifunctional UDP-3-O-[3-hydroxymyristoyl] N-acetylglucosamine deacetylase/3-hydroxyacyl-ACP dehydratase [Bacteroidales bacterium]|nr:bifunctional UDP-3-O-[3-hydroxymyristoyl] N-acetylglucosamine deacetylase/3-hydroxyacyl-ACP dehydratase [Bacteroidales bacterium]
MSEKQKTIKHDSVTLSGFGLHTGVKVNLTFKPAAENTGYRFKRIDLEGQPEVRAIADNVADTSRSTALEEKGARVGTVEHVLAAVYALGIDNILIELDAPETPILDGSAAQFAKAILDAGIVEQEAEKQYFEIRENYRFSNPEKGVEIMAFPDNELSFNVMVDYNSAALAQQFAAFAESGDFVKEIAPCKTFVFASELAFLAQNNLIKGGTIDSALVIIDRDFPQTELDKIADLFNRPHVDGKGQGILNAQDLIFSNEPARHKLLDLIGDLALAGMPIKGKIIATRPGHASNTEFAKKIRADIKKQLKNPKVYFDLSKPAIIDINRIKQLMPHRYPFLLVDKIIEISDHDIVGIKNITFNEPQFMGHFPDEPVMPGVLLIEAMAQTGGILVLNSVDEPEHYSTYFAKIDKVKFKNKVVPGDTLVFHLEFTEPIRRGIVMMKGQTFVNGSVVCEGEFVAMVTKNR